MQPDEAIVYEFCMDFAKDRVVSDAKFKKARELFSDHDQIDDLLVAEKLARFFECGIAYHVILRKVHAELVHGGFVWLHGRRALSCL